MLETESLSAYYDGIRVLWDVSISLEEKMITCVVGSNGAGKSTLLKTLSGIHPASSGRIIFEGKDISRTPAHVRLNLGICLVPEGRRLFPTLSVRENLLSGAFTARARSNINEGLGRVHNLFPILKEREKQTASTLSGGEQQMLAIARALMSQPKLLLLDEPSMGLSPVACISVFNLVKRVTQTGVGVVLVEQKLREALELAQKSYVMDHGKIVLSGSGRELLKDNRVRHAYLGR